jgi:hypothetical protein
MSARKGSPCAEYWQHGARAAYRVNLNDGSVSSESRGIVPRKIALMAIHDGNCADVVAVVPMHRLLHLPTAAGTG